MVAVRRLPSGESTKDSRSLSYFTAPPALPDSTPVRSGPMSNSAPCTCQRPTNASSRAVLVIGVVLRTVDGSAFVVVVVDHAGSLVAFRAAVVGDLVVPLVHAGAAVV